MSAVTNFLEFKVRFHAPTLVLVDLHVNGKDLSKPLGNCRFALEYARSKDLPVAFVRQTAPTSSFLSTHVYPPWIRGFEPRRCDMIFDRALPSCYSSTEFAQMAQRSKELVLAGFFGETACLSTLTEAYNRNHPFTYLADASSSRSHSGVPAAEMHRSVVGIASFYSNVSSTQTWIERMSMKAEAG